MDKGSSITSRVAITTEQMEGLLEFLEQNPALGKGKTKPLHLSQKLWTQCAKKLNTFKNGAKKNGKQWAKSWTDMKYRVRRRALELQAIKAEGKPRPDDLLPLSRTEERILSVIGKDFIEKVVIKSDPSTSDADMLQDIEISQTGDIFQGSRSDMEYVQKSQQRLNREAQKKNILDCKRRRLLQMTTDNRSSPPAKKPRLISNASEGSDSDSEDSVSAFLEMEKRKIDNAGKIADAVCDIRNQITRLTEVFVELKDVILSSYQPSERKKENSKQM